MNILLQDELKYRASIGQTPVTLATIEAALMELGYQLDRMLDCRSLARWMSGPRAGKSYPALTTGIREVSTGLSFANINAGRGEDFQRLQALRLSGKLFAVIRGFILEI